MSKDLRSFMLPESFIQNPLDIYLSIQVLMEMFIMQILEIDYSLIHIFHHIYGRHNDKLDEAIWERKLSLTPHPKSLS